MRWNVGVVTQGKASDFMIFLYQTLLKIGVVSLVWFHGLKRCVDYVCSVQKWKRTAPYRLECYRECKVKVDSPLFYVQLYRTEHCAQPGFIVDVVRIEGTGSLMQFMDTCALLHQALAPSSRVETPNSSKSSTYSGSPPKIAATARVWLGFDCWLHVSRI